MDARRRGARERGHAEHGWLESWHTFSFADYFDPAHMGYRALRVINEDFVQPAQGFGTHPHRDMEIVTWILEGELQHKDSMGNGSVIRPGEMQYMSAGSGVTHSEFNPSKSETVHLLQIWILPGVQGATPRYGQKDFSEALAAGGLVPLVSPDGADGSIAIRQDARILAVRAAADRELAHELAPGRGVWLQVARGEAGVGEFELGAGDGLAIESPGRIAIRARRGAEVLLFDLP